MASCRFIFTCIIVKSFWRYDFAPVWVLFYFFFKFSLLYELLCSATLVIHQSFLYDLTEETIWNLHRFTSSPGQSQTVFHSQRSRIVIRKLAPNDKTKSQVIPVPDPSIFQRYIREHARKSPRNGFMFVYRWKFVHVYPTWSFGVKVKNPFLRKICVVFLLLYFLL